MKKVILAIIVIAVIAIAGYFIINSSSEKVVLTNDQINATSTNVVATSTVTNKEKTVLGQSVEGREIAAYHFGTGEKELLFVGGIHGGYGANTVAVANELVAYIKANPNYIPVDLKVTVIPVLNPDGLADSVRFNANDVDLNRNFDCDWQASGVWQSKKVSGGTSAFSEPEALALKNYVEINQPEAVVAWYSASGGVYSSNCHNGVLADTTALNKAYSKASGYTSTEDFDFYEITGDLTNWLAKINIPAISVLLTNHTDTEWTKNKAGIDAILKYYSK
ncbi:MAG: DUF2817 domain-containing protein [Candidatus Paceibacterota bacterium]